MPRIAIEMPNKGLFAYPITMQTLHRVVFAVLISFCYLPSKWGLSLAIWHCLVTPQYSDAVLFGICCLHLEDRIS